MLILTRRLNEEIVIGNDEVRIRLLEVRGLSVRLGITAPDGIQVHRKEVYDRIKQEEGQPRDDNGC